MLRGARGPCQLHPHRILSGNREEWLRGGESGPEAGSEAQAFSESVLAWERCVRECERVWGGAGRGRADPH